ncbi:MAG: hypothetical protein ACK57G_07805 [Planctomycetota bacterium]|jgi:GGDEF domain-containing protein
MDLLLGLDLDWLCILAEIFAGLLLVSIVWRPRTNDQPDTGPKESVVNWEPLQAAYIHAATAVGRSLAVRGNFTDEQRLQELQAHLPDPYRDGLTGTWNAEGMNRLIQEWSLDLEPEAYPSSYVLLTLSNADHLTERYGMRCVDDAIQKVSELLVQSLGGRASISRDQPTRFLIHHFGNSLSECTELFAVIEQSLTAYDFFSFQDEAIALECQMKFWFCDRGIETEQLIRCLEESEMKSGSVPVEASKPLEFPAASAVPEKPFSVDDLAPFPCPWDNEDNEPETPASLPETEPEKSSGSASDSVSEAKRGSTEDTHDESDFQKVGGVANPQQIEELLSLLNSDEMPDPSSVSSGATGEAPNSETEQVQHAEIDAEQEPDNPPRADGGDDREWDGPASDRSEVPPDESAVSNADPRKKGMIYTDDIESALLKDDLASLFEAMRSSASGDFGFAGNPGSGTNQGGSGPASS